nr:MAG TPA: hypothetical protein [Caudoviricetes sp.]
MIGCPFMGTTSLWYGMYGVDWLLHVTVALL